ncbi:ADP-ribosylglycohydrolase family protein [Oscillatoria sp. FACHB-1407]|uniref:ADP-ribosylglycohydrolase family protein n=1 Tax=Oscillatoria sp. FACHB-1407 TaxID=2692847 RepID=UPI001685C0FA|nr:ADP-ribosylglycohydrolase family protein [Oscillatoria sp. FACHB-1407]MBD2462723.1 ADP-ribosylglycohydrolase family protein [Oscillatoria sp. FACHB-1407]
MHYSLQSRFQGALLGAALGEVLGFQCQTHRQQKPALGWQRLEQWGWQPLEIMPSWSYGRTIANGTRQLIERQQWNVEGSPGQASLTVNGGVMENAGSSWEQGITQSPPASLVVLLPIALYFHDDLPQLRYQLQQAIAVWHPNSKSDELLWMALTVAYAIALALHHQPQPHQFNSALMADLIDDLELAQQQPQWAQTLTHVADWVVQGRGVRSLVSSLSQESIPSTAMGVAIALGTVLNTPNDFRLSVLRAARLYSHSRWICTLVGALSGAYNGMAGLPLAWRSALHRHPSQTSALEALWDVASETVLMQLADQLLAAWAGVYQISAASAESPDAVQSPIHQRAIAAPGVIRPR